MSIELTLTVSDRRCEDGFRVVSGINWLRNPYGLCNWVEDNVGKGNPSLYYVCNEWSYNRSNDVDRPLFKRVVDAEGVKVKRLTEGHFAFDTGQWRHFVLPHMWLIPTRFHEPERGQVTRVPMETFSHPVFELWKFRPEEGASMLDSYKAWYEKLERFAALLQHKETTFHCSN